MNVSQVAGIGMAIQASAASQKMDVAVLKEIMDMAKIEGEAALKLMSAASEIPPQYIDTHA